MCVGGHIQPRLCSGLLFWELYESERRSIQHVLQQEVFEQENDGKHEDGTR